MESPDFGPDFEKPADPRGRYRALRFAFTLGAIALGLQSADMMITLAGLFGGVRELFRIIQDPRVGLIVGGGLSWSAAISAYLLIGGFPDRSWRRRAAWLAVFNTIDVVLWAADNGSMFGFSSISWLQSDWIRNVLRVFQWFELLLFTSLAVDLIAHLGRPEAADTGRFAKGFAALGLTLWALVLFGATRLGTWPPGFEIRTADVLILWLGGLVVLGITAFLGMLLCALAARESGQYVREWKRHLTDPSPAVADFDPFDERRR